VDGSCEHGVEPSGSIKCLVAAQLAAPQEGLSSLSKYYKQCKEAVYGRATSWAAWVRFLS
jgi:hypothetical protein